MLCRKYFFDNGAIIIKKFKTYALVFDKYFTVILFII